MRGNKILKTGLIILALFLPICGTFAAGIYKVSGMKEMTADSSVSEVVKIQYASSVVKVIPEYTGVIVEICQVNARGYEVVTKRLDLPNSVALSDGLAFCDDESDTHLIGVMLMYHITGEVTLLCVDDGVCVELIELNVSANDSGK